MEEFDVSPRLMDLADETLESWEDAIQRDGNLSMDHPGISTYVHESYFPIFGVYASIEDYALVICNLCHERVLKNTFILHLCRKHKELKLENEQYAPKVFEGTSMEVLREPMTGKMSPRRSLAHEIDEKPNNFIYFQDNVLTVVQQQPIPITTANKHSKVKPVEALKKANCRGYGGVTTKDGVLTNGNVSTLLSDLHHLDSYSAIENANDDKISPGIHHKKSQVGVKYGVRSAFKKGGFKRGTNRNNTLIDLAPVSQTHVDNVTAVHESSSLKEEPCCTTINNKSKPFEKQYQSSAGSKQQIRLGLKHSSSSSLNFLLYEDNLQYIITNKVKRRVDNIFHTIKAKSHTPSYSAMSYPHLWQSSSSRFTKPGKQCTTTTTRSKETADVTCLSASVSNTEKCDKKTPSYLPSTNQTYSTKIPSQDTHAYNSSFTPLQVQGALSKSFHPSGHQNVLNEGPSVGNTKYFPPSELRSTTQRTTTTPQEVPSTYFYGGSSLHHPSNTLLNSSEAKQNYIFPDRLQPIRNAGYGGVHNRPSMPLAYSGSTGQCHIPAVNDQFSMASVSDLEFQSYSSGSITTSFPSHNQLSQVYVPVNSQYVRMKSGMYYVLNSSNPGGASIKPQQASVAAAPVRNPQIHHPQSSFEVVHCPSGNSGYLLSPNQPLQISPNPPQRYIFLNNSCSSSQATAASVNATLFPNGSSPLLKNCQDSPLPTSYPRSS